jgi:hypothetical protein
LFLIAMPQAMDIDYVSCLVPVSQLGLISEYHVLCTYPMLPKDCRLNEKDRVCVVGEPLLVYCYVYIDVLVNAFLDQGVVVQASKGAIATTRRRVHYATLTRVLENAGVSRMFIYVFGMKDSSPEGRTFWRLVNNGGSIDNTYDLGKTVRCGRFQSFSFAPPDTNGLRARQLYQYSNDGGSIEFWHGDVRVKIYNNIIHYYKSMWSGLHIPFNHSGFPAFREKLWRMFDVMTDLLGSDQLGYRIEVTVEAPDIDSAQGIALPLLELEFWLANGVVRTEERFSARHARCGEILRLLDEFNVFRGRHTKATSAMSRRVLACAAALLGWSITKCQKWIKTFLPKLESTIRREFSDLPRPVPPTASLLDACRFLKLRKMPRGSGYTLSKSNGISWSISFGVGMSNESSILRDMVRVIESRGLANSWQRKFITLSEARILPQDFNPFIDAPAEVPPDEEFVIYAEDESGVVQIDRGITAHEARERDRLVFPEPIPVIEGGRGRLFDEFMDEMLLRGVRRYGQKWKDIEMRFHDEGIQVSGKQLRARYGNLSHTRVRLEYYERKFRWENSLGLIASLGFDDGKRVYVYNEVD